MNYALEVKHLSKSYPSKQGTVHALHDVSFRVKEGEIFAFLGANGSGKTTTLNIVADILEPNAGEIFLLGKKRGDPGYYEGVSFMSGDSQFMWMFTGYQILKFYSRFLSIPWKRVSELVGILKMEDKLGRSWSHYSNGEKTKIRLIRALMKSPKILFLDEPTVGLDPEAAATVRESLRVLNGAGMTVVLTSHYMKDIESLADTVCFIHKGRIKTTAPLSDFTILEDLVEIEYTKVPDGADRLGKVDGHRLFTNLNLTPQALKLGSVRSVRTVQRDLEDVFLELAREGEEGGEGFNLHFEESVTRLKINQA